MAADFGPAMEVLLGLDLFCPRKKRGKREREKKTGGLGRRGWPRTTRDVHGRREEGDSE